MSMNGKRVFVTNGEVCGGFLVADKFFGHQNRARIFKTHLQPQKGPISLMVVVLSPASLGLVNFLCVSSRFLLLFQQCTVLVRFSGQLLCTLFCVVSFVVFLPHATFHCLVSVSCMPLWGLNGSSWKWLGVLEAFFCLKLPSPIEGKGCSSGWVSRSFDGWQFKWFAFVS